MKKSNKLSAFYILCSLGLMVVLAFGGIYGIYISVGLNFVKSSVSNITNVSNNAASNVSLGGSVNFESSMTGVIILSIALIVLAIFDIISLIRQVILFKQFKMIKESKMEQKIEKKVKSKGAVVFFAVVIDILSFAVGVAGIFVNSRAFIGNNISWILYLIDGLVSLFALLSLIFLIIKVKKLKPPKQNEKAHHNFQYDENCYKDKEDWDNQYTFNLATKLNNFNIDELEYKLLKLKHLKSSKIISVDEYNTLREKLIGTHILKHEEIDQEKK